MIKHSPQHPCGGLPISHYTINVWYCHHHQAFFGSRSEFTDDGAEELLHRKYVAVEFGPFDTATDVKNWVQQQIGGISALPKQLGEK